MSWNDEHNLFDIDIYLKVNVRDDVTKDGKFFYIE